MSKIKKLDYKKDHPELYRPSKSKFSILQVPKMRFFMVDGIGDPNTSESFKEAVELLYGISYTLKMKIIKKNNPTKDYVVPPLEGLWYMDDMNKWSMKNKEEWKWKMMIRIPDYISKENIEKAIILFEKTKNPSNIDRLYYDFYEEGLSAQILFIGPYENEPPVIEQLHKFIKENGYFLNGKHHEIYLSDMRRTAPEKLKTILRQPMIKK